MICRVCVWIRLIWFGAFVLFFFSPHTLCLSLSLKHPIHVCNLSGRCIQSNIYTSQMCKGCKGKTQSVITGFNRLIREGTHQSFVSITAAGAAAAAGPESQACLICQQARAEWQSAGVFRRLLAIRGRGGADTQHWQAGPGTTKCCW